MSFDLRTTVGDSVRQRIMGSPGEPPTIDRRSAVEPGWFDDSDAIHRVHSDPAMFIGGIRAILLQSLHPLAMAGVADHSGYRADPWGRLRRTAEFLGSTTFGTVAEAERAVATVRRVHTRVTGTAPDGRPYSANDPHLLSWVHVAEVDSFLAAHLAYGRDDLGADEQDAYVADMAVVATALGADRPPHNVADLRQDLQEFGPELRTSRAARDAARFLVAPPLPLPERAPYTVLFAAAVGLLPWWARLALWLPPFSPITDRAIVRPAASVMTDVLRWALAEQPVGTSGE